MKLKGGKIEVETNKCKDCKYYYVQQGYTWCFGEYETEDVEMCCRANMKIRDIKLCNMYERAWEE